MKSAKPAGPALMARCLEDTRLAMSHTSLLLAILKLGSGAVAGEKISVSRRELMKYTKFRSIRTYHKCMRTLVELGYIGYEPTYDYFKGSKVVLKG